MTLSPRLLFLSSLAFGLVTGLFVGNLGHAIAAPLAKNGQENSLIVLVDDLTSERPALEGIWLAARSEGSDTINWEPIYPLPMNDATDQYAKPHSAIYLPTTELDDPSYLPPLRSQGAWWNEVFWMDTTALGFLSSAAGQTLFSESHAWVEPQAALYQQVQLLSSLCKASTTATIPQSLDQVLALMPNHLRTSVTPFDLITRWDSWAKAGFPLNCDHPWAD